jgi:RNA polymerase sigma-70 factor, ECF subfamily
VRGSSSAIRVGPYDGNVGSIMRIWLDCSRDANLQKRPLASAKRHPPAAVRISRSMGTRGCSNSLHDAWFLAAAKKNPGTTSPLVRLVWRDVTRGYHMLQTFMRSGLAAAAVPATAATAGNYSSDEMLVERIAAGDKVAMQVLFARHRTAIYRWLLRFVGNETVAEDLLSDVFFDVWRQAGRFEGRAAVTTWLLSIARFKALSARRRRVDAELNETIESTVADTADDPEITLQKKSRNELLRQALKNLSPDHRQIIDLVYYHEKSVDDAAQILGIPSATVKTRMFYARKKLAELVQEA